MSHHAYRATLIQPIGKLNPIGARLSVPFEAEVYRDKGQWRARERTQRNPLPTDPSLEPEEQMRRVEALFERREGGWLKIYTSLHARIEGATKALCGSRIEDAAQLVQPGKEPTCPGCARVIEEQQRDRRRRSPRQRQGETATA